MSCSKCVHILQRERDALKAMLDALTQETFSSMERLKAENAALLERLERAEELLRTIEGHGLLTNTFDEQVWKYFEKEQEAQREEA